MRATTRCSAIHRAHDRVSGVRPPVDLIGAEKTGTNLLARLLGLLGYTTSKSSVSRFIPSSPDDTLGYSEAEFMSDPERIYIWPWPKAGLPRSLVVDTLGQLGPSTYAIPTRPIRRNWSKSSSDSAIPSS